MKPEAQRIAIAEACGFTKNTNTAFGKTDPWWSNPAGQLFFKSELPDYLSDLNAMHEAEQSLNYTQQLAYQENLWLTVNPQAKRGMFPNAWSAIRLFTSATASQRAEAFLRTLNLWTES